MNSLTEMDGALRQAGIAPLDYAVLLMRRRQIFESSRPRRANDPANGSDRKGEG